VPIIGALILQRQFWRALPGGYQPFLNDDLTKGSRMRRNYPGETNHTLRVSIQPNIGLDGDARQSIVKILNTLLADEAILTMKTHSAYWHVHGAGFLEFRSIFDQQYHELMAISDEIAERVRMLGGFVVSSFAEFINYTRLEEQPGEEPDMMSLLADHEAAIRFMREDARKCLEDYEDHGTYTLLARFIVQHEKLAWMLRSYIEPEVAHDDNQIQPRR
jgi:starvation-inducible DNA-binding protein